MRKSIFFLGICLLIVVDIYSQQNEWTWMKGDSYPVSVDSSLPVYGPIGVASASYRPGKRTNPIMWASTDGTIWLFGGTGYSDISNYGLLNDLWKYNPATNEWTWVKGDNTIDNISIYSNPTPSLNKPGGRDQAVGWVDASGDFWLFGGYGKASTTTTGLMNDLWKYNIASNTWTFVKGDNIINVTGVYSNVTVLLNKPGSRYQSTSWRIGGNLYLFGGWGRTSTATTGYLNDLWRYTIATNTWTWIKGDNTINNIGVYSNATLSLNKPGGRYQSTSWVDANGIAWLFGGNGLAASVSAGVLNDLWKYDASGNTWTWVKGNNITNVVGVYGTQGIANINNKPGSKFSSAGWADNAGNLWLFGGNNSNYVNENDLWRYNILANTWTWMKGYNFGGQDGIYGTQGVPDDNNFPGARNSMASCKDVSGNFWLFGGSGKGYPLNNSNVQLNELWKFNPIANQWTWVRHNNEVQVYFPGNYGVQGNPLINNKPGGKSGSSFCTEGNGNYWLFGGRGNTGSFNDLWRYNESSNTWTWMKGDSIPNRLSIYGTLSQANILNKPGSRNGSVMWKGGPDTLWLFGGYGFGNSVEGSLNDLWCYKISSNTWTWIKGDSSVNVAGVYDQAPGQNRPGGRTDAVSWTDPSGSLWLFGGTGYTNSGSGDLNDLWKYNVSTNVWSWVKGDNATYTNGVYGTKGVPNINNKPGSRNSATAWVENNNLWMFGGSGNTDYNSFGLLNDLWKYNSLTNEWTWVNGDIGSYIGGIYGTIGIPGAVNKPGSRNGSQGWNDGQGNLWLFGGDGFLFYGLGGEGELNDLWKYNIASNQWTWMKGDNSFADNLGEYGTQGVSDPNNKPGGRKGAIPWRGSGSKIWLFGGYGFASTNPNTHLNDLWKYELPCAGQLLLTPLSGALCYSGSSVPLNVSGGTSYVWYKDGVIIPGQTGNSYTATTPGSYNVKGNVGSCLNVYSNEVFIQSPSVAPSLGGTGVYCAGSIVNVGIPDTEIDQDYLWLGPLSHYVPIGGGGGNQSLQFTIIDASSAGTYIVESTKPGCNTVYSNYVYVGFAEIKGLTITNLCPISSSSATVTFTWDRVGPSQLPQLYEYAVTLNPYPPPNGIVTSSNTITSNIAAGLPYRIYVRARCGFDLTNFGEWTELIFQSPPAASTPTVSPVSATICQGSSQLLTATGGDTYQWTLNGSTINGATGNTYSATLPGTYRVYAFTNGCNQPSVLSNSSVITVTALPTGTISPASATICSGNSQLLTATGGTSYQWSRNGTPISGAITATYSATIAGTYSVVITNNGCSASASNTSVITVTALPTGTISPSSATICSGNSQLLTATGGTSYQWSRNGTPISGATTATYSATLTGTYSVVITNNGCSASASNTSVITVTALPTGNISPSSATICSGSSQLLTTTGGTAYQWSRNGTPISGATSATYTAIATGTYSVVIINGTCSGPASNTSVITVTALPTGTISPASATFCAGNSQLLTATGGTSYQWSLNGTPISGATSATYTAIATGTYSVVITNGTCSGPASNTSVITVTALPSGTISPASAAICSGSSQLLTATGGTSNQWSRNGTPISGATAATYSATLAGTYSVVITNNGCSASASNTSVITVTALPTGTISPASATFCSGSSQLLTTTGGTSYQWSLNGSPISGATSATYTAIAAGTYSVVITNGSCSAPASNTSFIIVTPLPTGTISPANASICAGGSQLLTATGGTSYQWSLDGSPIGGATSATYTALVAGTYSVVITNGTCSGPASNTSVITFGGVPTGAITPASATICPGGSQLLTATGGTSYQWSLNGTPISGATSATYTAMAAGTYSVVITNGTCSGPASNTAVIIVNTALTSTTNISICANQLPYNWNGNSYTAAGTYSVTLISVGGCDSVATLNLTVKSLSASTTNAAVCANQLPYVWNGNNYSVTGIFNVTLNGSNGCDSIATLNLTVKPVSTSTTNVTICTNQLPYSWNNNNYTSGGIYNVTLIGSNGCDSIATLNLTVNSVLSSTTNAATCANQLPYSWNGNNYTTTGSYNVTLVSVSGCDSIATLNLTVNPVQTSTTNVSICATQLPYSWNGNNYTTGGTYNVTLVGVSGCDSIATLNLTVNTTVASTTNATTCTNQLPFNWNGNSYNTAGTYNITLIGSSGCDSIATLNLTINPVLTSTTNVIICTTQLPYNWNGNNYTATGTYNVTLAGSNGCDSIATLNLTVNSVLTSTTNVSVCTNQLPYSWNGNNYTATGTYNVTLTSVSGCDSIATLNLTVKPVTSSNTNVIICNNQLPYSWNGSNYTTAGTYNVILVGLNGCDSVATLNLTVNPVLSSTTNVAVCINQLPYSWNGNNYNAAGSYSVTLVSSTNCDSIATLNLTVNPILASTTNVATCANQLPYNWNGNIYSATGTYTVTLISSTNCDSIATLNLTVNPVLTSTTNAATCANQLPYVWNGNNYTATGTYTITLTGSNNCDSLATLNLTVNPALTSTTNATVCANRLPYNWNGNNYNAAGTYTLTLTGSNNCDSIATLILAVNPVLTSTTNTIVCANRLPYNWNGNNYNAAGTYTVTLTGSNSCDSIATLNLSVNPVLTSTTNTTVCANRLPYSWNGNNYTAAGSYNVTLNGSNGCDSIATLNLTVNPVLTSITNATVCAGQLPYSWNGNNYTAAGSYNVTLNGSNGCDSIATLVLTVNSLPTGNISPANVTICPGATQLLTVTGGVSYQWYLNGVAINGAVSSTFTATTVGTYTAEIINANGCKATAANSAAISNFVKPVPDFAFDIFCQNQPVNFLNNSTAVNSGGVNYNWSFGDNTISSSFAPIHTYAKAGPFTVTLTATSNICPLLADSIKKVITVNPAIPGIKYPPARVLKNVPATLSARSIGQQYTWQPSFGLSNSSISTPVVTTANDQLYTIRIISTGGCITVDTLLVQAFAKSEVFVPKAFTPNSNNANDLLRPLCVNIPVINYFRVYNRWGQLVYQTQTPGDGWNGVYKNVAQPMETFTWIFEGVDANGAIIKANGKTLLIR